MANGRTKTKTQNWRAPPDMLHETLQITLEIFEPCIPAADCCHMFVHTLTTVAALYPTTLDHGRWAKLSFFILALPQTYLNNT